MQGQNPIIEAAIYGSLQDLRRRQGLPNQVQITMNVPEMTAHAVLKLLDIPPELVEAVFCNGRVINIYDPVRPGDRVAFFPFGTPGPYRVFLGMARENQKRRRHDHPQ